MFTEFNPPSEELHVSYYKMSLASLEIQLNVHSRDPGANGVGVWRAVIVHMC